MFKWKKLGRVFNPLDVKDRPWLKEFAQAPCTLIFDDFVRVYFSCRPLRDEYGQYVSYSSFVDLDRRDLFNIINISRHPILELGELGTFDEFGVYPVSVICVGELVYAYYGGWTRCASVPFNVAIGLAISYDDGTTFERCGKGPVLAPSLDEPFVLSGPKIRKFNNFFYLWYIAGCKWIVADGRPESVYKIRMARSLDGISWERGHRNLITDRIEQNEAQAGPDVIFRDGYYHMFFSYRYGTHFRGKERGYRIGYASSDDMQHWVRDDNRAGIDVSDEGWDSEMVTYPHVFELDGNTYMLYNGSEVGRYGFGLAVLEET